MATPLTALGSLLTNIMARTDSAPFNTPVDTVSVKDYTTVVSSPIDLGTIAANLHDYTHYNALAADIQRVFTNCMLYNAAGSDYHTLAAAHLERFEVCRARIQAVAPREEGGGEYARPDTAKEVNAKATLTGRIFALTPNDLGGLLEILDKMSPHALSHVARDDAEPAVELCLDSIDNATFAKLEDYVAEKEGRKRKR